VQVECDRLKQVHLARTETLPAMDPFLNDGLSNDSFHIHTSIQIAKSMLDDNQTDPFSLSPVGCIDDRSIVRACAQLLFKMSAILVTNFVREKNKRHCGH
jgi:hypothetical protein